MRHGGEQLVFRLSLAEKHLLVALFKLYPRMGTAVAPLSKSGAGPEAEDKQRLLDEALAEQREENRRQLADLLADPKRFKDLKTGCLLVLSRGDFEWVLQILNDIRVGSWTRLGSPEEDLEHVTGDNLSDLGMMDMSGMFVVWFLQALRRADPTPEG